MANIEASYVNTVQPPTFHWDESCVGQSPDPYFLQGSACQTNYRCGKIQYTVCISFEWGQCSMHCMPLWFLRLCSCVPDFKLERLVTIYACLWQVLTAAVADVKVLISALLATVVTRCTVLLQLTWKVTNAPYIATVVTHDSTGAWYCSWCESLILESSTACSVYILSVHTLIRKSLIIQASLTKNWRTPSLLNFRVLLGLQWWLKHP